MEVLFLCIATFLRHTFVVKGKPSNCALFMYNYIYWKPVTNDTGKLNRLITRCSTFTTMSRAEWQRTTM